MITNRRAIAIPPLASSRGLVEPLHQVEAAAE
jgi:hypothetical protein